MKINIDGLEVETERTVDADFPSPWISVKEALPPRKTTCLITTTSNHHLGFDVVMYEDGAWWYYEDWGRYCAVNVTHWMLIPEVPS